jgi:DnaD/phage-associated family protein
LLSEIEDAAELKVTLFFLWRAQHMEGPFRALCQTDFEEGALGLSAEEVALGLEKAVQRGSLLKSEHDADVFYFLNSPRGRAAAEAFAKGDWRESARIMSAPVVERPNVFKLYEENFGPLTPMIADTLKDAEETYSEEWIAEALEIAVKNNVRNWKYVEAILKRWREKGKHEGKDRQDAEKGSERYTKSEFEEYL